MLRGRHGEGSSSLDSNRRTSLAVGVLFLLTFVASIAALALFQPVLDTPVGYVAGSGSDNRILFGAFLELLLIIANIGTAVVLFPILRRQNETVAVGWVTASIVECTIPEFFGSWGWASGSPSGIQAVTGRLAPASSPVRRPRCRSLVRLRWVLGITGRVQRSTDSADIGPAPGGAARIA